jgi:hypothetical protein
MFEKPVLPVQDEKTFGAVGRALDQAFSPVGIDRFLRGLSKAGLRVRDFEGILSRGLLGADTAREYAGLGDSDQGQVREKYLWLVEQVAPEFRAKYLKVYAYY